MRQLFLNAPFGARCFLTLCARAINITSTGLNVPYGARCFLTMMTLRRGTSPGRSLNVPFGARCFLTQDNAQRPLYYAVTS